MSSLFLDLTFYHADWRSHGGVHRSLQVAGLLRDAGMAIPPPAANDQWPGPPPQTNALRRLVGKVLPPLKAAVVERRRVTGFRTLLHDAPDAKVMIWENTLRFYPLREARRRDLKVIAVPQQTEALDANGPARQDTKRLLASLSREVSALVATDAVFALSREDAWFLRLCGAEAFCLPYYPPAELAAELASIRAGRPAETAPRFLLVGTAIHPATMRALQEVLGWLLEARKNVPFQLDVAGFGTEALRPLITHADFALHGAVTHVRLAELQRGARGAIVHHPTYSGGLTRISEMLMAGIPVIANEGAARCAPEGGLHVYRNADELSQLLSADLPTPPVPPRPVREERFFIETVKRLVT